MISPMAVVLAVALPLLLCLLVLLGILLLRSEQLRASDAIGRQALHGKCAKLEKQLAAFPKTWDGQQQDTGFSRGEVSTSFDTLQYTLDLYVDRWIDSGEPRNESAVRIEALLFPEPPPKHALTVDKDTRVFHNPHHYTPAEIYTLLKKTDGTRKVISHHIMSSILLHAISLEGDPFQTLLPLGPPDMYGLDKLKPLIQGVDLSSNVRVHISKFGLYYAHKGNTKARFIALFESLLEPHFTIKSPVEVAQRRLELQDILDVAIQLGMRVLGQSHDKTEYRWGMRDDNAIMTGPALHALVYEDEKLEADIRVSKSYLSRVEWG